MRFDIDTRLEYIYNNMENLTLDEEFEVREEIGNDVFDKFAELKGIGSIIKQEIVPYAKIKAADLTQIKQNYLKHKRDKDYTIGNYDQFFLNTTDQEIKDMVIDEVVGERMFDSFNPDEHLVNLLCGYTTTEFEDTDGKVVKIKGSKYEARKEDLKKIIQQYIKNGYNPYPMMNKINEKCLKSQDKQEKAQGYAINQVLENCEKTFSPYQKVFDTAEKLGEMINKSKELRKQDKIEESVKLDEEIDDYKMKIRATLAKNKFDLIELEDILAGKSRYLKESEPGFNYQSSNYDMYQGLLNMKGLVHMEQQKMIANENNV